MVFTYAMGQASNETQTKPCVMNIHSALYLCVLFYSDALSGSEDTNKEGLLSEHLS
jgi:hypothetical protein